MTQDPSKRLVTESAQTSQLSNYVAATDPRVPPTPVGQADGKSLQTLGGAFVLATPSGGGGGLSPAFLSQVPQSGDWVTPQFYTSGQDSCACPANQTRYSLIYLPAQTYKTLGLRIGGSGGGAGAVVRLGLFAADGLRGLPGTLLADGGTIPGDTAYASGSVAIAPLVWPGGLVWAAASAQGANSSWIGYQDTTPAMAARAVSSNVGAWQNRDNCWWTTGVSGAFASDPTMTFALNVGPQSYPQIGVQAT